MKAPVGVPIDDDVNGPSHTLANGRGAVILVIDDEAMIRMVASKRWKTGATPCSRLPTA